MSRPALGKRSVFAVKLGKIRGYDVERVVCLCEAVVHDYLSIPRSSRVKLSFKNDTSSSAVSCLWLSSARV